MRDRTVALFREGYDFGRHECARRCSDVVEVRVLGRPVTLLRGPRLARVFYSDRMVRAGAMPRRVRKTLVGDGTIQNLDGPEHHARKAAFLALLSPERSRELAELFCGAWRRRLPSWQERGRVVLYDEVGELLCEAVCRWGGVPLPERDVGRRTRQLHALVEGAGGLGPRYLRGRVARWQTERWAGELVRRVRSGQLAPPPRSALAVLASLRGADGTPLDMRTAAAELLNVLRPTVAATRFVIFAALALHEHPQWRERVARDDGAVAHVAQEVRRYYPFFPAIGARAARPFEVDGAHVPAGRLVVLDLHGTDRDPSAWTDPEEFRPERFEEWSGDTYTLVPQGGGEHATGHRCPGEWVVLDVLQNALRLLTRETDYQVPPQDLSVRHNRLPAVPRSRFVVQVR
jgi:fatty-acid peroxygenase